MWINWDGKPSGCARKLDNRIFFEDRLHWQFEVEKISSNSCFRLHIYLCMNNVLIHNSLHVFDMGGGGISVKKRCSIKTPDDGR